MKINGYEGISLINGNVIEGKIYANIVSMLIPNISEASINQLFKERKKTAVIIPNMVNIAEANTDTSINGTTGK